MHLVAIAWIYVALMMAVAEATNSNGTVLGAIFTFVLYGLLPLSIALYLMGTPIRRKARQRREQEARALAARPDADVAAEGAADPGNGPAR